MIIEQIKDEARIRLLKDGEEGFVEGAVYGINETINEAILLLQVKFGYEDIYFKEAKKILTGMKI